ncbi:DegT/DnrJ/EryC1/StrS aminotransferase family protein [bacterium]|nr:DegT/DnrJ/EryC1/StrS aminotransferase family protein [candidate division CSSED10-310 bacterium]
MKAGSFQPAVAGGAPVRAQMLPFNRAWIGDEEIQAVVDTLQSGWLTTGPRTKQFEKDLSDYLGAGRVVCLNSCTSALHLALVLKGIGPGDEVITTPISFPSTSNVIIHTGADVVFADVKAEDMNIDPREIEKRITPRTRAILPVHMAGEPCDMTAIRDLCNQHNLILIQDSAHALECTWDDVKLAQYGDLSCFSFYVTKNITTAEGGALAGADDEVLDRASTLSIFGISKDAWKRYNVPGYQHWETMEAGYKYNMFDIQAALGLVQLKKIESFRARRLELVERYDRAFRDHPGLLPWVRSPRARHAHYLYVLRLETDRLRCTRDEFMAAMEAEKIGIGIHFRSLAHQFYYRNRYPDQVQNCRIAELIGNQILSIPLYPLMSNQDCDDVIEAVLKLLTYFRR